MCTHAHTNACMHSLEGHSSTVGCKAKHAHSRTKCEVKLTLPCSWHPQLGNDMCGCLEHKNIKILLWQSDIKLHKEYHVLVMSKLSLPFGHKLSTCQDVFQMCYSCNQL